MQNQAPSQGIYVNADQPSFSPNSNPNSLLPQSEIQEIDKKLSSGCWACYNCWTYVIVVGAFIALISSLIQVFTYPIMVLNICDAIIEVTFGVVMQEAIKNKKLEDAKGTWCLSITSFLFVAVINWIQASTWISQVGANTFYGAFAGLLLYYVLVYILPAYQIKALIERREAAMRRTNQFSA